MAELNPVWTTLPALQCKFVCYPVMLNDEEFIVAPDRNWTIKQDKLEGIWTFNIRNNEWKMVMVYPPSFRNRNHSACYDEQKKLLYLIGGYSSNVTIIHCSQQFPVAFKIKKTFPLPDNVTIGAKSTCFFHNGMIDIFCGKDNKSHYCMNTTNYELRKVTELDELIRDNASHCSLYLKSKNCYLLLGGYDFGADETQLDGIWRFDMSDGRCKKWQKLDTVLPRKIDSFGCVLTKDEKHIILFGGCVFVEDDDPKRFNDEIFVINVQSMVIWKSSLKCPSKGLYQAILMPTDEIFLQRVFDVLGHWKIKVSDLVFDEDMLVRGFIRSWSCHNQLDIPNDIYSVVHFYFIRITNIAVA